MRKAGTGPVLIAGLLVAGAAFAHGGATGIVKDRMHAMTEIGRQMKAVGGMFKSGTYDAALVSAAGAGIAAHAGETLDRMFPEGSLQAPTEASPAIWAEWARFQTYSEDLKRSALDLKAAADRGADRQEAARVFGVLAGTCKTCHQAFRISK